uniref:Uncharacterized protein n=1 Tax=Anopheles culicifacies TaxID=139723 RepID=A0A182LTM4_9DIPT
MAPNYIRYKLSIRASGVGRHPTTYKALIAPAGKFDSRKVFWTHRQPEDGNVRSHASKTTLAFDPGNYPVRYLTNGLGKAKAEVLRMTAIESCVPGSETLTGCQTANLAAGWKQQNKLHPVGVIHPLTGKMCSHRCTIANRIGTGGAEVR